MTTEEETCGACGKPLGTGSLLDFQPDVPAAGAEMGMKLEMWQDFAARYVCPNCDAFRPVRPAARLA